MQLLTRKIARLWTRLPVQMVVMLVALVTLSALAVGLPAMVLLQEQTDRQAWSLAGQGLKSGVTALEDHWVRLDGLAELATQRPTLWQLIQAGQTQPLSEYLEILRLGAEVDALVLCRYPDGVFMAVGSAAPDNACSNSYYRALGWPSSDPPQSPGIISRSFLPQAPEWAVVMSEQLDQPFFAALAERYGVEYVLIVSELPAASSFEQLEPVVQAGSDLWWMPPEAFTERWTLDLPQGLYYLPRERLYGGSWVLAAALRVDDLLAVRRGMTIAFGIGILVVIAMSSVLGMLLSRRIGRPLERLRQAATALRMGDLTTPVVTATRVKEIAQVAAALEDARIALRHGLNELQREKDWSERVLASIVEGIMTIDRGGRITFFSQGAERVTGWQVQSVTGRRLDEIFLPAEGRTPLSESLPESGAKPALVRVRLAQRPATLALTRANLAPAGMVLVFRDVSDEEALRRLLGDFLADITHEFRTPLAAQAAAIELLLDQLTQLNPAELKELLDSLHLGVLGLQTLIDNLLEGASIEAGRFRVQPRPCEVSDIVAEALQTMQPLAEKYEQRLIVIQPHDLPGVQADYRRSVQVVVNLLSNAIKWGPQGGEITLSLSALPEGGVHLAVSDQGPGVPSAARGSLFERFTHRDDGNGRAEAGAGIGLSVVKAIILAQGGQVGVQDAPTGGAVFWCTFLTAESGEAPGA